MGDMSSSVLLNIVYLCPQLTSNLRPVGQLVKTIVTSPFLHLVVDDNEGDREGV